MLEGGYPKSERVLRNLASVADVLSKFLVWVYEIYKLEFRYSQNVNICGEFTEL